MILMMKRNAETAIIAEVPITVKKKKIIIIIIIIIVTEKYNPIEATKSYTEHI